MPRLSHSVFSAASRSRWIAGVVVQVVQLGAGGVGEAGHVGVPHREALVVLGGDHQVLHAGVLGQFGDGGGVEAVGLKFAETWVW